jgi:septum formation protein
MENRPIVLGSTSRYRKALLARLGVPFETAAPNVGESPLEGEAPVATCERLALAKARAVAARYEHALVIGSDQVANADGVAIGKPGGRDEAIAQLARLSGRAIVFHTGVALVDAASGRSHVARVDVTTRFRTLSSETIEAYVDCERPFDCAGSIKSEGLGIALVEGIDSADPTALIGLPLITVVDLLRREGFDVVTHVARSPNAENGSP